MSYILHLQPVHAEPGVDNGEEAAEDDQTTHAVAAHLGIVAEGLDVTEEAALRVGDGVGGDGLGLHGGTTSLPGEGRSSVVGEVERACLTLGALHSGGGGESACAHGDGAAMVHKAADTQTLRGEGGRVEGADSGLWRLLERATDDGSETSVAAGGDLLGTRGHGKGGVDLLRTGNGGLDTCLLSEPFITTMTSKTFSNYTSIFWC